jgi:hypothetical protein
MMNDDIKEFSVYGLSKEGLVPIEIESTDDYNHYTHHLHHFITQQEWKRNKEWYKERGIEQKLILMPVWVHREIHDMQYSDKEFEKKFNVSRWDLLFNRHHTKY